MSKKKNKLVYGWGTNDVDYNVYKTEVADGKKKTVWTCPYYKKWCHMLERCFSAKSQEKYPTYGDCTVCEEWRYLSNFIKWVDSQPNRDWENCDLDKDFLIQGNKHYSPDTCVFIEESLNNFITDNSKNRGKYMIGVSGRGSNKNPYQAQCNNPTTGKKEYLGMFPTEMEAHLAWKAKKHEHARNLAELQSDQRLKKALIDRYKIET